MRPLNRAKSLDSVGEYIISESIKFKKEEMFLYSKPFKQWVRCDESTWSISFKNMIDIQEKRIFASFTQNSGLGGDIIQDSQGRTGIVIFCTYENKPFVKPLEDKGIYDLFKNSVDFFRQAKIIGIK